MARMYPPNVNATSLDSGERGEYEVYKELEKLPRDWVVIHDYWRYFMDKPGNHVNYESDFIVLIPRRGFVVVEVKNWYKAQVKDGCWEFLPRGAEAFQPMGKKQSPLNQAFLAAKKLNDELCKCPGISNWYKDNPDGRVEYRALAILLNQVPEEVHPHISQIKSDKEIEDKTSIPLKNLYICGGDELKNRLQEKIENLFSGGDFLSIHKNQIEDIVKYLLPCINFNVDPLYYSRVMESATAAIHGLLQMLENCKRGISVVGCAGSGKTWIAVREIVRIAGKKEGNRILYLCYNTTLAEHIRRLPELQDGIINHTIRVETFHGLCSKILKRIFTEKEMKESSFINGVVRSIVDSDKYDYIFVDEAQDFHPTWWFVTTALHHADTKVYYFSDDNQNIFTHGKTGRIPATPTKVMLSRNLRNSSEIARYSSAMLPSGHELTPLDVPGNNVIVLDRLENVNERAELTENVIALLTTGKCENKKIGKLIRAQYKLTPVSRRQIVVLSPYATDSEKVNSDCSIREIKGVEYATTSRSKEKLFDEWLSGKDMIMGTTIRSFKGLEADYIVLTDVGDPNDIADTALNKNDFYVACTRAKFGLVIIPKSEEGEEYARSLLKK